MKIHLVSKLHERFYVVFSLKSEAQNHLFGNVDENVFNRNLTAHE